MFLNIGFWFTKMGWYIGRHILDWSVKKVERVVERLTKEYIRNECDQSAEKRN